MFTEKFVRDKYNITEKFMTARKANFLSFLVLLPLYIIGVVIYVSQRDYANIFATLLKPTFLLELFILLFGIVLFIAAAMLVKALLLSVFSEGKMASMKLKLISETQKPYCSLKEPIKIWQEQFCLAVYILIAGIAPYIVALIIGDFLVVLASFICMFFAGTDILFLFILFGKKRGAYVLDFDGIILYRVYEEK